MKAGNYICETFGKIKISQDPAVRFQFPLVQPQVRSCRFRFSTGELPENSLDKVWAASRLGSWHNKIGYRGLRRACYMGARHFLYEMHDNYVTGSQPVKGKNTAETEIPEAVGP